MVSHAFHMVSQAALAHTQSTISDHIHCQHERSVTQRYLLQTDHILIDEGLLV